MKLYSPASIDAVKGVSPEVIADLCRVHVSTARRWKRYGDPPYTALQLIKLLVEGELGVVDLKWANWQLREGKLASDDRVAEFTPGEVRAIPARALFLSRVNHTTIGRSARHCTVNVICPGAAGGAAANLERLVEQPSVQERFAA